MSSKNVSSGLGLRHIHPFLEYGILPVEEFRIQFCSILERTEIDKYYWSLFNYPTNYTL